VRDQTCVLAIAGAIGRVDECAEFEERTMRDVAAITAAREAMAEWYRGYALDELTRPLDDLSLAPGAEEAFALLRDSGVETAIVSITWSFAVDWFAARLGADYAHGTRLSGVGIEHVWPEDKGPWLSALAESLGLAPAELAAVGDSDGDRELLAAAGLRFFVGREPADLPNVRHLPAADMLEIAERIISHEAPTP
jgi:phosphoserine phosphatase